MVVTWLFVCVCVWVWEQDIAWGQPDGDIAGTISDSKQPGFFSEQPAVLAMKSHNSIPIMKKKIFCCSLCWNSSRVPEGFDIGQIKNIYIVTSCSCCFGTDTSCLEHCDHWLDSFTSWWIMVDSSRSWPHQLFVFVTVEVKTHHWQYFSVYLCWL